MTAHSPGKNRRNLVVAATLVLVGVAFLVYRRSGPPNPAIPSVKSEASAKIASSPLPTTFPLVEKLETFSREREKSASALHDQLQSMNLVDVIAALEVAWVQDHSAERSELVQLLIRRWAEETPHAAAQWLSRKPDSELHRKSSLTVALAWSNQNLSESLQWVRQWPDEQKESGLISIAYEATREAPVEALRIASELGPSAPRNDLIAHAVREWAGKDTEAPVGWAEQLESTVLRNQVFSALSIAISDTDPIKAGSLALEKLPPGNQQDSVIVSVVQRWAQQQPADAGNWIATFPDGSLRQTAIHTTIQLWAEQNPATAAAWIENLDQGSLKDAALASYSAQIAGSDPAAALTWADDIHDPAHRERELEMLVERWLSINPEQALTALTELQLNDEAKARLTARGKEIASLKSTADSTSAAISRPF